jgi:chemotaxis signal transduction protein
MVAGLVMPKLPQFFAGQHKARGQVVPVLGDR